MRDLSRREQTVIRRTDDHAIVSVKTRRVLKRCVKFRFGSVSCCGALLLFLRRACSLLFSFFGYSSGRSAADLSEVVNIEESRLLKRASNELCLPRRLALEE